MTDKAQRRRTLQEMTGEVRKQFLYHAASREQNVAYAEIRDCGFRLAECILRLGGDRADTWAAIRKVREAVMTANAGIACGDPTTVHFE